MPKIQYHYVTLWAMVKILVGPVDFSSHYVKNSSGAHWDSYSVDTRYSFLKEGHMLTPHVQLGLMVRMGGTCYGA